MSFYGSSHRKDDTYTIIVYNSPASAAYKHTLLHLVVSLSSFSLETQSHYVAPAEVIDVPVSVS